MQLKSLIIGNPINAVGIRFQSELTIVFAILLTAVLPVPQIAATTLVPGEEPQQTSVVNKQVRTVSFCDLLRRPKQYKRKLVRTEAIAVATFESAELYDSKCVSRVTRTDLQSDNRRASEALRDYLGDPLTSSGPRRSRITVVGRIEGPSRKGYGHLNFARFRFVIKRVEKGEAVASDVPFPLEMIRQNTTP
jgi:hypothetical protein